MRIMFYTASLGKGGAERVISNLTDRLADNNDVSILTTIQEEAKYDFNNKVSIKTLNPKNKKNFILKNLSVLKNLRSEIKSFNSDIIICFLSEPALRTLLLKKLHLISKKHKVIISVRNDPKVEYKSKIRYLLMKLLFKKADGFIFQTEEAKDYFNKIIKVESVVIPNPISNKFISKKLYTGSRNKTIVNIGRLTKQKNQLFLLETFKEIVKDYPDYTLKIYGEGELRKDLENYISSNNLEKNVKLCGIKDNLENEINKDKMFILSSIYEGMPNALMEAMALGIPSISTDCPCGGPKYLIDNNKNGILVPINDKEELKKAIIKIIEDAKFSNTIGKNAHDKMLSFTEDIITDKWLIYLKKVIDHEL